MLSYGLIASKQSLGSYQNQSADEMQQKRLKRMPKASFDDHDKISYYLVSDGLDLRFPLSKNYPSPPKIIAFPNKPEMQSRGLSLHVSCLASKSAKQGQICSWRNNVPPKPMVTPW